MWMTTSPSSAAPCNIARAPGLSTIPPPHEMTRLLDSPRTRPSSCVSATRNASQLFVATKSPMEVPNSAVIASSRSTNSSPRASAKALPSVDFPQPRMPIRITFAFALTRLRMVPVSAVERCETKVRASVTLTPSLVTSSQNSGYVFSTQFFSVTTIPGTTQPRTAKDIAMRWSSWHTMRAPWNFERSPPQPSISIPSGSSRTTTPHLPSSLTITAMRLHSLARWFAIFTMLVVPDATAATTHAVMNASVMSPMSISPGAMRPPDFGAVTVVESASCLTAQPIFSNRRQKFESPCRLWLPTPLTVTVPPDTAASARG
mmetsp:Transcript_15630/g.36906  ORF Transcript_15630/g.36906 Transcript_15630/m.36906 type:complete len:317 (-) Transcript_15630:390-1340(-)